MTTRELINTLTKAGQLFRTAREGNANALYASCVESLLSHGTHVAKQQDFVLIMKSILEAQERQDWISVADSIEFELPIILNELTK